jgi:hypothetical protein
MPNAEQLDVFLSYNRKDKEGAVELYEHLIARELKIWLDEPKLAAGFPWIDGVEQAIQAAVSTAILVGKSGMGPSQEMEAKWCVQESTRRLLPVIPVLLPGASGSPKLPLSLSGFTWVDLREGIAQGGIDRLVWAVTGIKATEADQEILVVRAETEGARQQADQPVDAWGISSVKSRLHALSGIIAEAAVMVSAHAAETLHHDLLSILVPITVELRWNRGYAAALEKMLRIPVPKKRIRDFPWEEVPGGGATSEGVLSSQMEEEGRVLVLLDGHPALVVSGLKAEDQEAVMESVELYGRLGVPSTGGMSLAERIGEIPVRPGAAAVDELATVLYQNREILAPLVARLKNMPGSDWLLAEDEEYGSGGGGAGPAQGRGRDLRSAVTLSKGGEITDEVFDAKNEARWLTRAQIEEYLRRYRP